MIKELLAAANLEDALADQIKLAAPSRGLYIFLDDQKKYESQDLTEAFLAKNTSFICKDVAPNPLLEEKIKQLNIYGFAISGNKQILSVQGLNSVYSQLYTVANIKNFLSSDKEVQKAHSFFTKGFTSAYVEDRLNKIFTLSGSKDERKEMTKKKKALIAQAMTTYEETIEDMPKRAMTTFSAISINKKFINQIVEKYAELYPSEIKTIRLNIIVSHDQSLDYLPEESSLYYYYSLLAHQGIYHKNQAYFYSAISMNYNEGKPLMFLNRSDAPNIGNELILEKDFQKHTQLYLFIRALAQSSKNPLKTFYLAEGLITLSPSVGALRYKILDEKKSYYILDFSSLNEWNKSGSRPLDFECELLGYQNVAKLLTITNYDDLANIIFFGSKEKQVGNQLYVDKSEHDNSTIKNKYFEGKSLSPDSQKIYELIKAVGTFDESLDSLYSYFHILRKDLLLNSRYETVSMREAINNYQNLLAFWDTLTDQNKMMEEKIIYVDDIQNDEDYLMALVQLHLMIYRKVNTQEKRRVFNGQHIDKLIKTTRYSMLLNNLINQKKQYQFVFNDINKKKVEKKQEKIEIEFSEKCNKGSNKYVNRVYKKNTQNELLDKIEFTSICLKQVSQYQPSQQVISNREDLIYALVNNKVQIKLKNTTKDEEKEK